MRKVVVLSLVCLAILSLATSVIDLWRDSSYHAFRITVEISIFPKMRYEEVYKWGGHKLVRVIVPQRIVWYRNERGTWSGFEELKRVPVDILDLEDVALREVERATNVEITEVGPHYELRFTTDKGDFTVLLSSEGVPMRISRVFKDIKMKMVYENWDLNTPDETSVLRDYTLSDSYLFPKEIGRIIIRLDWFYIFEERGRMVIRGIRKGEWVRVEISAHPFDSARRLGSLYVSSSDPDLLVESR